MSAEDRQYILDAATDDLLDAATHVRTVVAGFSSKLCRQAARKALASSPRKFLAYCALARVMRAHSEFFAAASYVMVLQTPKDWPIDDFSDAAELGIKAGGTALKNIRTLLHPSRTKKGTWDFSPSRYLDAQKLLVFAPVGAEIHPELQVSSDTTLAIEVLSDRHLDSLARQRSVGQLSAEDKDFIRSQDPAFLDSIFRTGRSASIALAKLRDISPPLTGGRAPLPLSQFGDAGIWAEQLARDLEKWREGTLSWSDVDKGILLFGPPGVGKTSFVVSLAAECKAHLVAASSAKWQSTGI